MSENLELTKVDGTIERKRNTTAEMNRSQVIQQLSSLVLVDESTNFIEKQQMINEHSLLLHQHHQLTTSELENKIQFLSRLIMMGSHYLKKVQESVIVLRRDQSQLLERVHGHDVQVGELVGNIELLKDELASDLSRIERLEAQNRDSNVMKYTLYLIFAYLAWRRRYKSIGTLATVFAIVAQRNQIPSIVKSLVYKRVSP